jgi:hydroxyacylglutathione hydrolase
MFAGPPDRFWASIQKIKALPEDTWLACGHDYADDNWLFMKQHLSGLSRFAEFTERMGDLPRMPVRLSEQIEHNPFLCADDPEIAEVLGMAGADPVEVFAHVRELRNRL